MRWSVVIDIPTVLLSAIKLTQSPTRVLGAVERQLAPPPLSTCSILNGQLEIKQ